MEADEGRDCARGALARLVQEGEEGGEEHDDDDDDDDDDSSDGGGGDVENRVVTAAMAAAADDAARALLEARDDDGWSPLHYAANAGSAEVVAFLLASGADRLARDRWGAGVADAARHAKHRDVVRLLVGPSEPPPQKKRGPPAVVPRRRRAPVGAAT